MEIIEILINVKVIYYYYLLLVGRVSLKMDV